MGPGVATPDESRKINALERFREMLAAFRVPGLPVCRFYKTLQYFEYLQGAGFVPGSSILELLQTPEGTCKPGNRQTGNPKSGQCFPESSHFSSLEGGLQVPQVTILACPCD